GALCPGVILSRSRTLEIRPDTPGLALWLASLTCMAMAMQPGAGGDRRSRYLFIASGFFLGGAFVFTQKLLLAGPGLLLFVGVYGLQQSTRPPRARALDIVSF